ncbi:MAG: hypothetical protein Q4F95_11390 [Oscillospiraceae bacterium]|nr:hypothetical protein [Oscillospiraceae bacterium]
MSKSERSGPDNKKKQDFDEMFEDYCTSYSACECTGLIPAGADLTEEEFENYEDIFRFCVPGTDDERK